MSFLSRDNSIANRFPYPALLQEVVVYTDFCGSVPSPAGTDFNLSEFEIVLSGAATLSHGIGLPEHPGVVNCITAGAGDDASVTLPRNTFDATDSAVRIGCVIQFNALTDNNTIAGLGSVIALVGAGGPRVQLVAQVGSGFFLAESSGQTTLTTVPVVLGQWYRLEIVSLGTTNRFYIDGALVATHTAAAATVDACEAGLDAPAAVGTAGDVTLDLIYAVQSGLNR